jgi:DNA-binding NtrC family response regulator
MTSSEETKEPRILVVDDDSTLLKFFKIHLNKFFSKVIVVDSPAKAVDIIKDENQEIDLVISDYKMPKSTGVQLAKKIKNIDASIPVFMISGALISEEENKKIETKIDNFLQKPFSVEQLHQYIDLGLKYRDSYSELLEIVGDNKKLLEMIEGKRQFRSIKDNEQKERAKEILEDLKIAS